MFEVRRHPIEEATLLADATQRLSKMGIKLETRVESGYASKDDRIRSAINYVTGLLPLPTEETPKRYFYEINSADVSFGSWTKKFERLDDVIVFAQTLEALRDKSINIPGHKLYSKFILDDMETARTLQEDKYKKMVSELQTAREDKTKAQYDLGLAKNELEQLKTKRERRTPPKRT